MWYDFKFENPDLVKHIHSDLFFYIVDRWNRLGQKEKIGLPTSFTMEAVGINSYNTYKKALNDLIEFGFIKSIINSKNQHQSRVIALSFFDKAKYRALDEAMNKAKDKPLDTIIEEKNKGKEEKANGSHSLPLATVIEKTQQEIFLDWFNNRVLDYSGKMGKTKILSKTDENNLKKLRKSYPKMDDWNTVFKNMWKSKWCIETNNRTATHLLRVDNFNKYLSQENPFEVQAPAKKMAMVFGVLTDITEMDPLYINVNKQLGNIVDV
jgi:hypothetical protein